MLCSPDPHSLSLPLSLERRRLKPRLSQSNRHYHYRDITVTVASLRRRYSIRQEYCSIPLRRLISGSQFPHPPPRDLTAAPYTFYPRETILYADYCDRARRKSNYCRRIETPRQLYAHLATRPSRFF